jgi:hypothetical protein
MEFGRSDPALLCSAVLLSVKSLPDRQALYRVDQRPFNNSRFQRLNKSAVASAQANLAATSSAPRIARSGDSQVGSGSRSAAQQSPPVAIAVANAAAAERLVRAIIELVVKPAMVGAIRTASQHIDRAMIAKPRSQRQWSLPIYLSERCCRRE